MNSPFWFSSARFVLSSFDPSLHDRSTRQREAPKSHRIAPESSGPSGLRNNSFFSAMIAHTPQALLVSYRAILSRAFGPLGCHMFVWISVFAREVDSSVDCSLVLVHLPLPLPACLKSLIPNFSALPPSPYPSTCSSSTPFISSFTLSFVCPVAFSVLF